MALKVSATGKMLVNENGKLTCTCCICPTTTLLCATAPASKTKSGWGENDLGVPIPHFRFFKEITASGTITRTYADACGAGCNEVQSYAHSGTSTYDPVTGVVTVGMQVERCVTAGGSPACTTSAIGPAINNSPSTNFYPWGALDSCQPTQTNTDVSSTVQGPGNGSCVSDLTLTISGSATKTVSNEYTDAELIDNMIADLGTPGTPTTCGTAIIASFSLSSDGLTASGKRGDYAFAIPGDAPACYKINWDRVETPSSGSPTVTPMEYIWDGAATVTPTYSEDVPGDNTAEPGYSNAITIENIVVTCTGCE